MNAIHAIHPTNSSYNNPLIVVVDDSDEDSPPSSSHGARSVVSSDTPSSTHSPSLADDSDSAAANSDSDSDSPGPSLQMMGETHVRLSQLKNSHHKRLPRTIGKSTRIRMATDPVNTQPAQSLPSTTPVGIPPPSTSTPAQSPAMAFLAGFNSPSINMSTSLSPTAEYNSPTTSNLLASAQDRIGPYILGPVIAHGGFSVIRKGTSPSGVVAVKVIQRSVEEEASLQNEISIWSRLHHEYILPLFSSYQTDDSIFLVSLYCPAGSLFDILRLHGTPGLPQDDVGTMFRQIVRGLRYLHEQVYLIHADIKLENVLIDELGACRITDFGLSQYIAGHATPESDDEAQRSALSSGLRGRPPPTAPHPLPAGSLPYAAPELLLPPPNDVYRPHPAQDIWALGCLLHALLFGRLPFVDNFEARLQVKIIRGVWERDRSRTRSRARGSASRSRLRSTSRDGGGFRHTLRSASPNVKIGEGARNVLRGCLCVDARKRWTIAQIDEVAWSVGWEEVEEIAQQQQTDQIVEQQQLETLALALASSDDAADLRPGNQWETDGEGVHPHHHHHPPPSAFQIGPNTIRAPPILTRIPTKL